jgi:inhibitor of KinA
VSPDDDFRTQPAVRIVPSSDRALLVVFDDAITEEGGRSVRSLTAWLTDEPIDGVVDLHPAYGSVLVESDTSRIALPRLDELLRGRLARLPARAGHRARSHTFRVRYGGEHGPDLAGVARLLGRSQAEIVALHAGADYEVRFIGFAPGFPYLAGLSEALATPRREAPRRQVPAGSVAIAGAQAGIYPLATPGGWNLLGHTSAVIFDPRRDPPGLLAPGDRVRFVAEAGSP